MRTVVRWEGLDRACPGTRRHDRPPLRPSRLVRTRPMARPGWTRYLRPPIGSTASTWPATPPVRVALIATDRGVDGAGVELPPHRPRRLVDRAGRQRAAPRRIRPSVDGTARSPPAERRGVGRYLDWPGSIGTDAEASERFWRRPSCPGIDSHRSPCPGAAGDGLAPTGPAPGPTGPSSDTSTVELGPRPSGLVRRRRNRVTLEHRPPGGVGPRARRAHQAGHRASGTGDDGDDGNDDRLRCGLRRHDLGSAGRSGRGRVDGRDAGHHARRPGSRSTTAPFPPSSGYGPSRTASWPSRDHEDAARWSTSRRWSELPAGAGPVRLASWSSRTSPTTRPPADPDALAVTDRRRYRVQSNYPLSLIVLPGDRADPQGGLRPRPASMPMSIDRMLAQVEQAARGARSPEIGRRRSVNSRWSTTPSGPIGWTACGRRSIRSSGGRSQRAVPDR